jgi:hypothetical protein
MFKFKLPALRYFSTLDNQILMRAILLVFLNKHSQSWDISMPNIPYANLYLKYQKFLVTIPNL